MTTSCRPHAAMQAQKPLSTLARPFIPGAASKKQSDVLALSYMFRMHLLYLESAFAGCAQQGQTVHQDEVQDCSRGRSNCRVTKPPSWMPSRTPSPSDSFCVSETSTAVTSWKSKEDAISEVSVPDYSKELCEVDSLPVKHTFVHFGEEGKPNKLTRSHSAPGALWSAALNVENPSAKAYGGNVSEDGSTGRSPSSSSSLQEAFAQILTDARDHGFVQPPPGSWKLPNGAPVESVDPSTLTSWGAAGHVDGTCRPCAWHWKSTGCSNDKNCYFCHSCEPGALEMRKRERKRARAFAAKAKGLR